MTKHLLAIVLVGGMGIGISASARAESDAKPTTATEKLPTPTTEGERHMERAARDFRIRTYQTFRTDRAEYDRRQAQAAKLQQAWEAAGSEQDDQPKLIEWFEQATARTSLATDMAAQLPPLPTFVAKPPKQNDDSAVAETGAKTPAGEADTVKHDAHWQSKSAAASSTVPMVKSQAAKSGIKAVKATILGSPEEKAGGPNAAANAAIPGIFGVDLDQALDTLSKKLAPASQGKGR
jgi:hypothetical protein